MYLDPFVSLFLYFFFSHRVLWICENLLNNKLSSVKILSKIEIILNNFYLTSQKVTNKINRKLKSTKIEIFLKRKLTKQFEICNQFSCRTRNQTTFPIQNNPPSIFSRDPKPPRKLRTFPFRTSAKNILLDRRITLWLPETRRKTQTIYTRGGSWVVVTLLIPHLFSPAATWQLG